MRAEAVVGGRTVARGAKTSDGRRLVSKARKTVEEGVGKECQKGKSQETVCAVDVVSEGRWAQRKEAAHEHQQNMWPARTGKMHKVG